MSVLKRHGSYLSHFSTLSITNSRNCPLHCRLASPRSIRQTTDVYYELEPFPPALPKPGGHRLFGVSDSAHTQYRFKDVSSFFPINLQDACSVWCLVLSVWQGLESLGDGPLGVPLGDDLDFTDYCGKMPLFWAASRLAGILDCRNEEREPSTAGIPLLCFLIGMWCGQLCPAPSASTSPWWGMMLALRPKINSLSCFCLLYPSNRKTTKI